MVWLNLLLLVLLLLVLLLVLLVLLCGARLIRRGAKSAAAPESIAPA